MYPEQPLRSFRAAMYFAIGLAAGGLVLSIASTGLELWEGRVFRPSKTLASPPVEVPKVVTKGEDHKSGQSGEISEYGEKEDQLSIS